MVAKESTMRTVTENASSRQRRSSIKAAVAERMDRNDGNRTLSPFGEMQKRAEAAEAELERVRGDTRRQISELLENAAKLTAQRDSMAAVVREEARERLLLSQEVVSLASLLSRCGSGESMISAMLFGAVRAHGTGSNNGDTVAGPGG
jgi:hypothetical protein